MRRHPYPVPPSRVWSLVLIATYTTLVIAGVIILALVLLTAQPAEGTVVLTLWGGLSAVSAAAAVVGVASSRYRLEWIGTWGIVAGTSVYLVVTVLGLIGPAALTLLGVAGGAVLTGLWRALGSAAWRRWIALGVAVAAVPGYLAVRILGEDLPAVLGSAPTILVFAYAIGATLARAVQLSLVDLEARQQVIARRTRAAPEAGL